MAQKVYVTWDPLFEEVVCVHSEPNKWCKKCKAIEDGRVLNGSCYTPEEREFEIETEVFDV